MTFHLDLRGIAPIALAEFDAGAFMSNARDSHAREILGKLAPHVARIMEATKLGPIARQIEELLESSEPNPLSDFLRQESLHRIEAQEGCVIVTKNRKHFEPLAQILRKALTVVDTARSMT